MVMMMLDNNRTLPKFHTIYTHQVDLYVVSILIELFDLWVSDKLLCVTLRTYLLHRHYILQVNHCLISVKLSLLSLFIINTYKTIIFSALNRVKENQMLSECKIALGFPIFRAVVSLSLDLVRLILDKVGKLNLIAFSHLLLFLG